MNKLFLIQITIFEALLFVSSIGWSRLQQPLSKEPMLSYAEASQMVGSGYKFEFVHDVEPSQEQLASEEKIQLAIYGGEAYGYDLCGKDDCGSGGNSSGGSGSSGDTYQIPNIPCTYSSYQEYARQRDLRYLNLSCNQSLPPRILN